MHLTIQILNVLSGSISISLNYMNKVPSTRYSLLSSISIMTLSSPDTPRINADDFIGMVYAATVEVHVPRAGSIACYPAFPNHKHLHDSKVIDSTPPKFVEILEEITAIVVRPTLLYISMPGNKEQLQYPVPYQAQEQ